MPFRRSRLSFHFVSVVYGNVLGLRTSFCNVPNTLRTCPYCFF
jgi:hypothetical protein